MSATPTTEPIATPAMAPFDSPSSVLELDTDGALEPAVGSEIGVAPDAGLGSVVAPENAVGNVCPLISTVSSRNECT